MKLYPPRGCPRVPSVRLSLVSGSCFLFLVLTSLQLQGQACNDLSTVALDADCSVVVTPDMVLEGTYTDSLFVVQLRTLAGIPVGNTLTALNLGDTLRATVTDTLSGNSCWGLLVVEDHWAPAITCTNLILPCALPQFAPDDLAGLGLAAAYPAITENCGPFTRTYVDSWTNLGCNDPGDRSAYVERVWTASDASGNKSTCTQYLNIRRVHVNEVVFPADTVISCSNPLSDPAHTGQPYILFAGKKFALYPDVPTCDLQISYTDQVLQVCEGSDKILRTWVVLDDCLPTVQGPPFSNPVLYIQVIQVADKQGPLFACPKDTVVYTDPFVCSRSFDLPDVLLTDNCSRPVSLRADWVADDLPRSITGTLSDFPGNNWWNPDTLGVLGLAENLPAGIVSIRYTATDVCGNTATCSFRVTVSDGVPPLVACDEFTKVALGNTGEALVNASTFDDGSLDNCSAVHFKARRVEPDACQANDHFFDQVKFCCSDVGDTIAVILRVYDLPVDSGAVSLTELENHASDCLVQVLVEDKQKPICAAPLSQTVSCENFDPSLSDYGTALFFDNCCLDTAWELPRNYSQFDTLCNKGTIVRTFRAQDCHGLTSQCTQRIYVNYVQNYAVKFPDDLVVYDCDTTGIYGPQPEIYGKDCEFIAISYQDLSSTGGIQSCYRIERRWMIVNWCTYNSNLPLTEVPNPNPVSDPLNAQNLPGPIVAPHGHTPAPTLMRVSPNDPMPTDYSTFWEANSNGYVYRQIINVRDNVPPKIRGCPELKGPVEFCDQTKNDPQFWNEQYWLDPHITGSTDLCEGATELAITANDGCSKGNVSIRYLLYLDLDGDGVQETVINSLDPPPYNTVFYGNAFTPNFKGGTPRAFDERPVPPDEKYGFTIFVAGFVNRSAYVRWSTAKNPTQYVTPQLPHGLHRILWIVEDGCGNETYCDYPILVHDCRQPDLVCVNGLSTNIPATKSTTLWSTDFFLYAEDNCTPADQIRIGIRKVGTGTGFPLNPDGTPQTELTYTCDELGPQLVEVWAIDAAGNYNICVTYVIVQDNLGVCPNTLATVAGLVKREDGHGLEDVPVTLDGMSTALPPISVFNSTNAVGAYHFSNALPFGGDYKVTPFKDNDPLNGVSTFDLVLINKHILGLEPLNSPYKMIAADANNSRSITTFDIIELRKLILGINTDFQDNSSWRFVDKSYVFPNPFNPFQEVFPESRQLTSLQASAVNEDFVAIKVGDVNNNAITGSSLLDAGDRSSGSLVFDVLPPAGRLTVKAGEVFSVGLRAAEKVAGYQFTLVFPDLELLDVSPGDGMDDSHFGIFQQENALTTSFDNADVNAEFQLRFRARKSGSLDRMLALSGRITRPEAYPLSDESGPTSAGKMDLVLRFPQPSGAVFSGQRLELYQNQPNPWHDKTQIGFYLPANEEARFSVFDQDGKRLFTQSQPYDKGYHYLTLDRSLGGDDPGMLYYRLETERESVTEKMIRN